MSTFNLIIQIVSLLSLVLRTVERNKIISSVEAVERAKVLSQINQALVEASRIPAELRGLDEKELDQYVQDKGWYRD